MTKFPLRFRKNAIRYFTYFAAALLLFSCKPEEYVSLDGRQFIVNGEDFYPVMVNYVADIVATSEGPAFSPTITYEKPEEYEYHSKDELDAQMAAHFALMRQMGFNTVRLCFDRVSLEPGAHYYTMNDGRKLGVKAEEDREILLDLLHGFIKQAEVAGVKVMLLLRSPHISDDLEDFSVAAMKRFRDEPNLFAYDLFNEPLYFAPDEIVKNDAYWTVWKWKRSMMKFAPNQLLTIGFSEPIEVFRWDPSVMPVDFISFHTYNPLRVPNEIYWYSKYVDKPWMLGETSLPADNDSISYEEQRQFMKEVYRLVKSCGGSGFAWWEFQDEPVLIHDAAYNGLLNNEGLTEVPGHAHKVQGTLKPAVAELQAQLVDTRQVPCTCAVNYQNMLGYRNLVIKGKIIDKKTGKGIEGALVRGWNEWWDVGMNTFSDKDGNYTLYSNDECVHFEISAPGMTMRKFDAKYNYLALHNEVPPFDALPQRKLEYHGIHHQYFLAADSIPARIDAEHFVFKFDPELFGHAYYEADAGTTDLSTFTPRRLKR